jgi:hypothetical protein
MNPWKATTIGIALVTGTAFTTGLTMAYFMRPAPRADVEYEGAANIATPAPPTARMAPAPRPPVASQPLYRPAVIAQPAVATDVAASPVTAPTVQPAVVTQPAVVSQPTVVQAPAPVAPRPAVRQVAASCSTGTDRFMRIAKPGAVGALLGAGLGAVGGAIADGGKAAGKGALIGGLAGAAVGGGYGAYKTKNECGTIFGGRSFSSEIPEAPMRQEIAAAPQAALQPSNGGITVYNAR